MNDNPPGEPDPVDLSRIANYQPPNLRAMASRQKTLSSAYAVALALWSGCVFLTLCAFIATGSLVFLAVGYLVTVPYLLVCYKHRNAIDYALELEAWCKWDC